MVSVSPRLEQLELFPDPRDVARRLYHGEEPEFVPVGFEVAVIRKRLATDDEGLVLLHCDGIGADEETAVKNAVLAQFED